MAATRMAKALKKKPIKDKSPIKSLTWKSLRKRKQTELHRSPVFTAKTQLKKVDKRKNLKNNKIAKKSTLKINETGKHPKETSKKIDKKISLLKKTGNEKLTSRKIQVYKENPVLHSSTKPDYVSAVSYPRWLVRALIRKDVKELQNLTNSNKLELSSTSCHFSYADTRSADEVAILCGNQAIMEKYFKLKEKITDNRIHKEPNLLKKQRTGTPNFYMLGHATRVVQIARGGRDGLNAFLNYEPRSGSDNFLKLLIEKGITYKDLVKLSTIPNSGISKYGFDNHVVTATRLGMRALASAFAEGPAKCHMNDLHRATLKAGNNLPERILPISVVKKSFANRNLTPLHTAAINPNVKVLEALHAIDPNANIGDQDNWLVIHYAAVCEGPEPLKFLLKRGIPFTAVNKQLETPLHVASRAGRSESIEILLKSMASLEKSSNSNTSEKSQKSLFNHLTLSRNKDGNTALHLAVNYQRLSAVKSLLANTTLLVDYPSSANHDKITPLMLASSKGYLSIAEILISHGAMIEACDKKKRTPLMYAVLNGQQHVATMLISKGAEILKKDCSGNTASHFAAAYGWLECLKTLADVEPSCLGQENDWKITPLSIAYLKGHYGIVTWLLDGKYSSLSNINGKDMNGVTLFSSLLQFCDEDSYKELPNQIQYLLDRGSDCLIADSLGNTALHVFAGLRIKLWMKGDDERDKETQLTYDEYKRCFDSIMNHDAGLMIKNQEGFTPLHVALSSHNLILFTWMLARVDDQRSLFSTKWSIDGNILHHLLALPMSIWTTGIVSHKEYYDVFPIIEETLMINCYSEMSVWLSEKNNAGLEPLLNATYEYSLLKTSNEENRKHVKNFVNYVSNLLFWVCEHFPECIFYHSYKNNGTPTAKPISIVHTALSIPLEAETTKFALLQMIIQLSSKTERLQKLLLIGGKCDVSLIISSLYEDAEATKLILQATKEHDCTEGIHNVVLQYETNNGERKEVRKTLLMLIIERKEFDLIKNLQLSPKDWAAVDINGDSAWHYAARTSHHRTVDLLKQLEALDVPRTTNNHGSTPLHEATKSCDGSANAVMEPIEWLVSKGDVGSQDVFGRTALHYTFGAHVQFIHRSLNESERDPIAVVSVLSNFMSKNEINLADNNGNTVLHLAAVKNANISAVTLLKKGSDVTIKNNDGNTPLSIAVLFSKQMVALTLIQADSCVTDAVFLPKLDTKKDQLEWIWQGARKKDDTIYISTVPTEIVAKGSGWEAMVYVLLSTLDKNPTCLVQLVNASLKTSQYNMANQLLKTLEVNLGDNQLVTADNPLVTFAENFKGDLRENSVERIVLERLLSIGCPLLSSGSSMAIETAIIKGSWELVKYFKDKCGPSAWNSIRPSSSGSGPLKSIVLNLGDNITIEAENTLRELVELENLDINLPLDLPIPAEFVLEDIFKHLPAISWAALTGKHDLIRLLRHMGADVNVRDAEGRTPLMIALASNQILSVEALCENGHASAQKSKQSVKKVSNSINISLGATLKITHGKRKTKNTFENAESDDGTESSISDEGDINEEIPIKKIKILNKQLDFTLVDNWGRHAMHYMVEPMEWENVDLLQILYQEKTSTIKQLLRRKDKNGEDPLDLALKHNQRKMINSIRSIVTPSSSKTITDTWDIPNDIPDVCPFECKYDVKNDSKKFITNWIKENDSKNVKIIQKPCRLSGYRETGELVECMDTKQKMSVILNRTDLSYGRYGFHNFYRIELIKRRDVDLWFLLTNWGRIGLGEGERQLTPFSSLEAAVKEFKSVWKSKTGQEWKPFDQISEIPKKYKLIQIDTSPSNLSEITLTPDNSNEESDIVRKMIKDISNPQKLVEYAKKVNTFKISCPFGRMTSSCISRAREILDECEKAVEEIPKVLADEKHTDTDVLKLFQKTNSLSNEFYTVIPTGEFEYNTLPTFNDKSAIDEARSTLNRMEEVEVATTILTAAELRKDVDRISYIQSVLECEFDLMSPTEMISQKILQFIFNTSCQQYAVKGIISIKPRKATEKFTGFNKEEHQIYLWHGTKAVNLLSILRDGFLIDTYNSSITGRMFGRGLYLADTFEKSSHYCQPSVDEVNYMLLCQVAPGEMITKDSTIYEDVDENMMTKYDTLHVKGKRYPSNQITVQGVRMPLGPLIGVKRRKSHCWSALNFSEYVVRNSERVLPKFIVIYK